MDKIPSAHPYKLLEFDGEMIPIDEEIATIISYMWKLGIRTTNCCQRYCSFNCNHKWFVKIDYDGVLVNCHTKTENCYNSVWLVLESLRDYELLIENICHGASRNSTPFKRIMGYYEPKNLYDTWKLDVSPQYDLNNGSAIHFFEPQLTFPRKHIKYIERRLKIAFNRKQRKTNVASYNSKSKNG